MSEETERPVGGARKWKILGALVVVIVIVLSIVGYVLLRGGPAPAGPSLASVRIEADSGPMGVGDSRGFVASARDAHNASLSGVTFSWSLEAGLGTLSAPSTNETTFTATAEGTETVRVTGSFRGVTRSASRSVAILPPPAASVRVQAPASANVGAPFSLDVSILDRFGAVVPSYLGTLRFSSNDTAATLPSVYSFTATDGGQHTFPGVVLRTPGLRAVDATDTGNASLTGRATVSVVVPSNGPPVIASVSSDRSAADVGVGVAFTAAAADPDGDALTYTWDFGDGTTGTGATATHAYALPGWFLVTVAVDDGQGHSVTSAATPSLHVYVLVNHVPVPEPPSPTDQPSPVAVLSAEASAVQVGASAWFDGNASWTWAYDAALGAWTFQDAATNETAIPTLAWDFGDGATASGSPTVAGRVSHAYSAEGIKFVRLTATNHLGRVDTAGYTVLVTAVAPPPGGVKNPDVFTEVVFGEPDSLDPAYDYETSGGQVIQNVAETLTWYDREKADVFKPMLATKVPDLTNPADVTPNGLVYNFTLKSGVKFSSGTDLTCSAVEFSIERVLRITPPSGPIYADLPTWILDQSLTGYVEDDPGTPAVDERDQAIDAAVGCPQGPTGLVVQFFLVVPYASFLATMASTVASIIDPTPSSYRITPSCPSTDLSANYCHDQLVGTGPFRLRAWQPNQRIVLDRNDNYHRAAANFREVHILKVSSVDSRVLMLKAGDADFIDLPTNRKNDILDGAGNPLPGITSSSGETFIVQFLGFNRNINTTGGAPTDDVPADFFSDVAMRRAFAHAWKYTDFINNVLYGFGFSPCAAIPKGMFGYDATVPCYTHDLVKTQQHLEAAADSRPGNPGGGPDTYWDNGFRFTVYYNNGNLVREEGARQLKSTIEGLNALRTGLPPFTIDVQGLPFASYLSAIRSRVFALFFAGWAPDYADPDDYVLPFLRSGQIYPSRLGYQNTTLDALIDAQGFEPNPVTRLLMLTQIQLACYYDVPYIFMYQSKSFNVMRTWVTGFYENPMTTSHSGNYYYDLDK